MDTNNRPEGLFGYVFIRNLSVRDGDRNLEQIKFPE